MGLNMQHEVKLNANWQYFTQSGCLVAKKWPFWVGTTQIFRWPAHPQLGGYGAPLFMTCTHFIRLHTHKSANSKHILLYLVWGKWHRSHTKVVSCLYIYHLAEVEISTAIHRVNVPNSLPPQWYPCGSVSACPGVLTRLHACAMLGAVFTILNFRVRRFSLWPSTKPPMPCIEDMSDSWV
jgi:hypothetical protein